MKKKMKTRKKMKMLATPDVCVKVFGMLVLSCAIGHAQGYSNVPPLKNYNLNDSAEATHIKRILAFGDSLTEGYLTGGRKFYPYTTKLEEKLNSYFNWTRFEVLNEGVSGECAYMEMATRFPKILQRVGKRVSLVIIIGGTNDFNKLDCLKKVNVAHEVIMLHRMAHKAGLKSVMVTIPECTTLNRTCDRARQKVNHKLRGWALQHKNSTLICDLAKFLPMYNISAFDRKVFWDDELHPSKIGYDKIAALLFHTLRGELMPLVYNASTLKDLNFNSSASHWATANQKTAHLNTNDQNDDQKVALNQSTYKQKKVPYQSTKTHSHKTKLRANNTKPLKILNKAGTTNLSKTTDSNGVRLPAVKAKQIIKKILKEYAKAEKAGNVPASASVYPQTDQVPSKQKYATPADSSTTAATDRLPSKHLKQYTQTSYNSKQYSQPSYSSGVPSTDRVPSKHLKKYTGSTSRLHSSGHLGLSSKHLKQYSGGTAGSRLTSGRKHYKHYGDASPVTSYAHGSKSAGSHGSSGGLGSSPSISNTAFPAKELKQPHYTGSTTQYAKPSASAPAPPAASPAPSASSPLADVSWYPVSSNDTNSSATYYPVARPAAVSSYSSPAATAAAATAAAAAAAPAAAAAAPVAAASNQSASTNSSGSDSSAIPVKDQPPFTYSTATIDFPPPASTNSSSSSANSTLKAAASPPNNKQAAPVVPVATSNLFAHAPYSSGNTTQINPPPPRAPRVPSTTNDAGDLQKEFTDGPFNTPIYSGNNQ